MKVIDKIKEASTEDKVVYSFKFFPPKTEDGVDTMFDKMDRMVSHSTSFCEITWGAGGSTADLTLDIANNKKMQNMNVLALRGDPPHGYDKFVKTEGGFACAPDLVKHTREKYALTTHSMKACLLEFEFGLMKKKKRESLLGSTSCRLADEILRVSGVCDFEDHLRIRGNGGQFCFVCSGLMGKMVIGYQVKGRDPLDYFGITVAGYPGCFVLCFHFANGWGGYGIEHIYVGQIWGSSLNLNGDWGGDGRWEPKRGWGCIDLWKDNWCSQKSLKDHINNDNMPWGSMTASVSSIIVDGRWAIPDDLSLIFHRLNINIMSIKINKNNADRRVLKPDLTGMLSAKGAFNVIINKGNLAWWSKYLNRKAIHPRIAMWGWRLAHGSVPTDDNVRKKGICMVSKCACCV
ncbi:hypothetical protein GIB67_031600 [Kingdonia uniflora]|uniref:Methylenetetrahydrofolate reductase n=1 Tax=Kingdonia uniflora TaxID=39325 RepID=A0A7J7LYC6_9MAGN|nr:hypothetical protein GIB67_031600 [Kingdonia uniflora]